MLGVPPALGRVFVTADDQLGQPNRAAVLSFRYWRNRFGAQSTVLGQMIEIDGKPYRIIGVAARGFSGVVPGRFIDAWMPSSTYDPKAFAEVGWNWFRVLGRLAPGVRSTEIAARLQPPFHTAMMEMIQRHATAPPAIVHQFANLPVLVRDASRGTSNFQNDFGRPLYIVASVAAFILLIACTNLAGLLLARGEARSGEMAMRASLGANRSRLVRQLLAESVLLSFVAGGMGWLLAKWTAPILVFMLSAGSDPVQLELALNTRVLLFSAAVSALAALLFGLTPAWQVSAFRPVAGWRAAPDRSGGIRAGKLMLALQIAFASALVVTGAAFLFTLRNIRNVNPGFDPAKVSVLEVEYDHGARTPEAQLESLQELQRRVSDLARMESVGFAPWPILQGSGWESQLVLPGRKPSEREEIFYPVSPEYFRTLRIKLLSGRDFTWNDARRPNPLTPVIVNEMFARAYFGTADVVNRESRVWMDRT